MAEQVGPGDLFFFHFSGHGAELQPTSRSPPGRPTDPSLMTMDFCCGKPAVRGWQLNEWLKKLNKKKVRTIVILDSCHSGGAWRRTGESFRTPEGWKNVANLPADEEAITETAVKLSGRGGALEMSWSINPDGFTLMAACGSDELAAETTVNGTSYPRALGVPQAESTKRINCNLPESARPDRQAGQGTDSSGVRSR